MFYEFKTGKIQSLTYKVISFLMSEFKHSLQKCVYKRRYIKIAVLWLQVRKRRHKRGFIAIEVQFVI